LQFELFVGARSVNCGAYSQIIGGKSQEMTTDNHHIQWVWFAGGAGGVRKTIVAFVGLVVLGLLLHFSGFLEGFREGYEGHAGLPSCGSSHGQSDAKDAIENSPWAKRLGITVLAVTDAKTISANAQRVECSAAMILNSAQKGVVNYSFTNDPSLGSGKYYIRAELDVGSVKPYP
jgi:hypothetical protein